MLLYDVIRNAKYPAVEFDGYINNPIIGKTSIWDPLGDKLGRIEQSCVSIIPADKYYTIRLDGKNFSNVIPSLQRLGLFSEGYSVEFETIMIKLAYLSSTMLPGVVDVFTQSDEITIICESANQDCKNPSHHYSGRKNKLISLSAGEISAEFFRLLVDIVLDSDIVNKKETIRAIPTIRFDARIGIFDSYEDALELILWRSYDCSVNGLSQSLYLTKPKGWKNVTQLNSGIKLKFLSENNMLPLSPHQAYGTYLKRRKETVTYLNTKTGKEVNKEKKIVRQIHGPLIKNIKDLI